MMDYHRQNKVDVRIVRIFNTYGPRMALNDGRVMSNFILQALRGQQLTIYGDGSQTRSFCYVSDLVAGMIRMMEQDELIGPVNLGNPEEISMQDLARRVIQATGSTTGIAHLPLPPDDPVKRRPDITLAGTRLNWQPKVPFEEGLSRTIQYFRDKLAGESGKR
jgi:UDP-glucuronate decarboxylase